MKHLSTLLLSCFVSYSFGQALELVGGFSTNSFYHVQQNAGSFQHTYTGGSGYSFALGTEFNLPEIEGKTIPLKLRVGISKYAGSFTMSAGGRSYSNSTEATVEKTSLDIGIYPLNFYLIEQLSISVGGEFNFLLKDNTRAIGSSWRQCGCPNGIESSEGPKEISKNNTARLSSIFAYAIKLTEGFFMVPQYQFSLGLTDEFVKLQTSTKTMRHTFWIGIKKDL